MYYLQKRNPYSGTTKEFFDEDFVKFFKFGVVDNGILIILTALGVGMDEWIAKTLRVPKGWGPIIGATVGNAVSDGAAGLADGVKPAVGVFLGCMLPVVPVFVASALMKKDPNEKAAQYMLMGSSALMVAWAYKSKIAELVTRPPKIT